ncbi:uncharacterized protein LOC141849498 [Brevipalpus obovatus]|uniref:uncharacterized protein LOC141849498 n=1 Tax=Brevipalpus obovatus TaxID=246614 RepID=UPI003D9DED2A
MAPVHDVESSGNFSIESYRERLLGAEIHDILVDYDKTIEERPTKIPPSTNKNFQQVCQFNLRFGRGKGKEPFITIDYYCPVDKVERASLQIREYYDYGSEESRAYPQKSGVSLQREELLDLPSLWLKAQGEREQLHEKGDLEIEWQVNNLIYIRNKKKEMGISVYPQEMEDISLIAPSWAEIFGIVLSEGQPRTEMLYKMMIAEALRYLGLQMGTKWWNALVEYLINDDEYKSWLGCKVSYNYYKHLNLCNLVNLEDFQKFVLKSAKFAKILQIEEEEAANIGHEEEWRRIFHVICYEILKKYGPQPSQSTSQEYRELFELIKALKLLNRDIICPVKDGDDD